LSSVIQIRRNEPNQQKEGEEAKKFPHKVTYKEAKRLEVEHTLISKDINLSELTLVNKRWILWTA
jgi:hypothetical protein